MDTLERWNFIVEDYKKNLFSKEDIIQKNWEIFCSEIFGYRKIFNEIDSQRKVTIGSQERIIPDIILRQENKDIVDIELKQYSLEFSQKMEEQLISYLKILQISVGIIVCKKIYIYIYNYLNNDYKKLIIEFQKENELGKKFIELFSRENFNKNDLEKFVDSKNKTENNIQEIKNQISQNLVIDCLKNYFCEQYTTEEIDKAISDFNINVNRKENTIFKCAKCGLNIVNFAGDICNSCKSEIINPHPLDSKDYTRYKFNGNIYNKCRLVLAVVKYYVSMHPEISFADLNTIFYDKIQGNLGVVANEYKFKSKADYTKRFFCKPEDIIHLNGERVYVCNQWGKNANIDIFLNFARKLGYEITEY